MTNKENIHEKFNNCVKIFHMKTVPWRSVEDYFELQNILLKVKIFENKIKV